MDLDPAGERQGSSRPADPAPSNWRMSLAIGVGAMLLGALAAVAILSGGTGRGAHSQGEVEQIVRSYILEHPEIIREAAQRLQEREVAQVVDANRAALEKPFGSAWAGNENGDVVLVEFFDYACGFCRKSNADVERLLAEDDTLKVVWRELPVLGPDSSTAAEMSLAAAQQGRFHQFHDRLFASGRPTPAAVDAARKAAGVQPMAPGPAFREELARNFELARAVNASGTPTFVVGDQVLQGAVGYDALKEAVAAARVKS